ncbi:hypothetical protein MKX03_023112, partial [Papaver bracteatum]
VVRVISGDGVDVEAIKKEIISLSQSLRRGLSRNFTVFASDMVEVSIYYELV